MLESLFNKVAGLQVFSCEYCKIGKSSLSENTFSGCFCNVLFYNIFSKRHCWIYCSLHCIIVSFWNLNSLSFAFIRCTTHCHSLYRSLSLVAIHCHSLSLVVPLVVLLVVTLCHSLYHLLLFVAMRCHSSYDSLSPVITRCTTTTRLSFYKRSK